MNFKESLLNQANRIESLKNTISTEEATKNALILPFFQLLGYDVFNPLEFTPEFDSDIGTKKGEKVDYAIIEDGKPLILIECKSINENLDKYANQLFRYFTTSEAKFGILTNGIEYRFFTDLDNSNIMDLKPFLEIKLNELAEDKVKALELFKKDNFNPESLFNIAQGMKYLNDTKKYILNQIKNPNEEFVMHIMSQIYDGKRTQVAIDRFQPIIKKGITQALAELLNMKLSSALNDEVDMVDSFSKIVTTEEELEFFYMIKGILSEKYNPEDISYHDTTQYFSILTGSKKSDWVCRLYSNNRSKYVIFNDNTNDKYSIESITEIYKYKQKLL